MVFVDVQHLLRQFAKLDESVQKQYIGAAVAQVAKPYVKEIKAFTPRGPTGNLRRSVGVKTEKRRRRKSASATAIIGYRSGGSTKSHLGYHAWWIDRGVKARSPRWGGRALFIPGAVARKSKGLKPLLAIGKTASRVGLFFRSVRGFAGSNRFKRWADANMPGARNALVKTLKPMLDKAIAQQSRRDARAAAGKANR